MKIKRLVDTAEMKILRRITEKTLLDIERSKNIRAALTSRTSVTGRRSGMNTRRKDNRKLVKIALNKSSVGRRDVGRRRKQWSTSLRLRTRMKKKKKRNYLT